MKPVSIKRHRKQRKNQTWSISKLSNILMVYILHYKWGGVDKTQKVALFFSEVLEDVSNCCIFQVKWNLFLSGFVTGSMWQRLKILHLTSLFQGIQYNW